MFDSAIPVIMGVASALLTAGLLLLLGYGCYKLGERNARQERSSKRTRPVDKRFGQAPNDKAAEIQREMQAEMRDFRRESNSELRYHRQRLADRRRHEARRSTSRSPL